MGVTDGGGIPVVIGALGNVMEKNLREPEISPTQCSLHPVILGGYEILLHFYLVM